MNKNAAKRKPKLNTEMKKLQEMQRKEQAQFEAVEGLAAAKIIGEKVFGLSQGGKPETIFEIFDRMIPDGDEEEAEQLVDELTKSIEITKQVFLSDSHEMVPPSVVFAVHDRVFLDPEDEDEDEDEEDDE